MTFTDDEAADGKRDMIALVRAYHNDDQAGIEAILGGAGKRELEAILSAYMGTFSDLLIRLTIAQSLIEDERLRTFTQTVDYDTMTGDPAIHAAVERNIVGIQADVLRGG